MAFACPNCGRPHASSAGAARVVRCPCGQTLVNGAPAPSASQPEPTRPPPLPNGAGSPASGYDAAAAQHGLLIGERQAKALAAPEPFLVPEVTDSDLLDAEDAAPGANGREAAGGPPGRARAPRPRAARRRWPLVGAAVLAVLVAAGGAGWFLVQRGSIRLPPAVAGALDRLRGAPAGPGPAEVTAALERNARAFRDCVRAAERGPGRPRLEGRRVDLWVTVAPSGRALAPRLEEADLDRSPLGACLKSAARRMVFPRHAGAPVEVRIPLELEPR